jgi:hypothetical protein
MSQFKLNQQGKTAIIIASITGLAVAGNNGLVNQLASFLDSTIVTSVQAQTRSISPQIRSRAVSLDLFLRESGANSVAIQGQRAIAIFDGGRQIPLQDGAYQNNDLIFTVENGVVTSCNCEPDDAPDDEPFWLQHCPGGPGNCPDKPEGEIMPQRGIRRGTDVRGTFEQVNPENLNNRTQPNINPNITPEINPNRIQPNNSSTPSSPRGAFDAF